MSSRIDKNTEIPPSLQKVLTVSGLLVIALAIIASIDILITDRPYMHDILDIGYYGRYIVTILGGFGVGFLFSHLSRRRQCNKRFQKSMNPLLTAVTFSLLTYASWILLDLARLPVREMFGDLPFPWSKAVFFGLPFVTLALISLATSLAFLKGVVVSISQNWLRWLLVGVLASLQLASFISLASISSGADYSGVTFVIGIVGFITTPLAVAILAYFLLKKFMSKDVSIFTAATIGLLYQIIRDVSWEFRTNPEYEASLVFSSIVTFAAYVFAVAITFTARYAVRQKNDSKR